MMIIHNIKQIAAAFAVGCTLCAALGSCSDDWNDHYDASTQDNGTLWEAIATQANLSNFARVAQACGYDVVLNGSQAYSVFAPTDDTFTRAEADSLIEEYRRQQAAGTRPNDNTVVRQFLQNHIALYKYPVSSLTHDTIAMMNRKYQLLTGTQLAAGRLLTTNALYNNGLLFTIDRKLDYFPNVFEYLGHDRDLDSVYQFLNRYSAYEFIAAKSVPGDIVDGLTIYLDSVSELRNPLLNTLGLINSEDSTYWMLCPTNSEWQRLLTEYEPYFNYSNTVAKRDSMIYTNVRLAILGGTFFSRTTNPDEAFRDSAVSTMAPSALVRSLLDMEYPYYTYYKPFAEGGIFSGTDDIVCSNGHVRKASQFRISKYDTFLQTIKVEAEDILALDTIIDAIDPLIVRQVTTSNPYYNKVSGNAFVEIAPLTATAQVSASFRIPGILSNVSYDIYGVFVPATAADTLAVSETTKPSLVRSILYWTDQNGKEARKNNNRNLTIRPAQLDTLCLVSNQTFPTCSSGLADAQVKLLIRSGVSPNQTMTHSTTVRLDCLIIKPHDLEATKQ